jgi:general secretion pathway protein A
LAGFLLVGAVGTGLSWTARHPVSSLANAKPITNTAVASANAADKPVHALASAPSEKATSSGDTKALTSSSTDQSNLLRASLRDENEANRLLGATWGESITASNFCATASVYSLHCLHSNKGLAELARLNRPAVLRMRDKDEQPYYLVLTALTDNSVTLRTSDATHTMSVDELRRHFQGEFVALWREPHAFRGSLKPGDHGAEVDWVAAELAKIQGRDAPLAGKPYDEWLAEHVRDFQTARGLKADGLIGPLTFMHLNQAAGMMEPRLRGEPLVGGTSPE